MGTDVAAPEGGSGAYCRRIERIPDATGKARTERLHQPTTSCQCNECMCNFCVSHRITARSCQRQLYGSHMSGSSNWQQL